MNVDQRPDLGLQQHLHLTTELKQGIAILRMSAQELSEYARKCVEENPFFDDDDWVEPRHPLAPERYSQDVSADALFEKRGHGSPETFDAERSDLSQRSFSFDRFLTEGDTLDEHLLEQLRLQADGPRAKAIGEYLIGNIHGNGYLRIAVDQAAAAGLALGLEYHRGTATQTKEGARALLEAVGRPGLTTYWQPNPDISQGEQLAEIDALLPWISTVHVFTWTGANVRHPLEAGAARWEGYLTHLAPAQKERCLLLEFVQEDSEEAFRRDARTLRAWASRFSK